MFARKTWIAAVVVGSAFAFSPARGLAEDVVARYAGTAQGNSHGHAVMMLRVTTMGGSVVSVPIPNGDAKKATPTPSKDVMDMLKAMKRGTLVKISVEKDEKLGMQLQSVDEYKPQPGEDTPNGYVFSKTIDKPAGKTTNTIVVLTKFGQPFPFTVPLKKGDGGVMAPDPELMDTITKLQADSPVWAQHKGNQLLAIEPYTEPQLGKVTKMGETEVDGHKVRSAEVDQDGKVTTLLVPGKALGKRWVPDSLVLAQLAHVRAGAMVAFRTREDGDKVWLREIGPAPKVAPSADATDTPAPKKAK
ncbi:MAG TPA: hypothetical protein VFC78_06865 [Tepidisphaeraceae bacterium]|nr:hypothetical protein [Tepidisphaeraceae bacterium]